MDSPKKITDGLGREWFADLHLANMDAIEDHAGFTLNSIVPKIGAKTDADMMPWHEFLSDTLRIFDVFYALVKPQADALKLTKKDVRAGFATDELAALMEGATVQAIVDFFHRRNPTRAAILRRSVEISRRLEMVGAQRAESAMRKMNFDAIVDALPEITTEQADKATREAIAAISRNSATNSPDTSASTQR